MKTKTILKLASILAAILAPLAAQATLLVNFEITNPAQTVGPNDVVSINGRLTNTLGSDENLTTINSVTYSFGSTGTAYGFSFGPAGDFFGQFSGLNLAPGNSFDFIFGELTPNPPPVPNGVYQSGQLDVGIVDSQGIQSRRVWESISVTVGRQTVPEPASLALLGLGLAGLGFARRRKAA